jgi:hypothetical protein
MVKYCKGWVNKLGFGHLNFHTNNIAFYLTNIKQRIHDHPYKIMGTTKVSKSFSRRLQGLFKPTVFFILNQAFLPFSISKHTYIVLT